MVAFVGMNDTRLDALLQRIDGCVEGGAGLWTVKVDEFEILVISDEENDRMRIMSPVAAAPADDSDLFRVLLAANFDRALDAHYAVRDGIVWCLFVHRLSLLDDSEFTAAFDSVLTLARNTGTTFCSSGLVFEA